jgi:hypothetical protein
VAIRCTIAVNDVSVLSSKIHSKFRYEPGVGAAQLDKLTNPWQVVCAVRILATLLDVTFEVMANLLTVQRGGA